MVLSKAGKWAWVAVVGIAGASSVGAAPLEAQAAFQGRALGAFAAALQVQKKCQPDFGSLAQAQALALRDDRQAREIKERKLGESARCWDRMSQEPLDEAGRRQAGAFIGESIQQEPLSDHPGFAREVEKVALARLGEPAAASTMGAMMGLMQIGAHQTAALRAGAGASEGVLLANQLMERSKAAIAEEFRLANEADQESRELGVAARNQDAVDSARDKALRALWRARHPQLVFDAQKATGSSEGAKLWARVISESAQWAESEAKGQELPSR